MLWNLKQEYQRSQQVIDKLRSPAKAPGTGESGERDHAGRPQVLFDLLDEKMRSAITETMHRNIERLNQKMGHEWDEIFKKHEPAEPAPSTEGSQ